MAPLLEIADVHRVYVLGSILSRQRMRAVDGVSFTMEADRPEIFTIVGEVSPDPMMTRRAGTHLVS